MSIVVTPNFHFKGNCSEAIELYKKVFNAKILCLFKNEDTNPLDYISDINQSSLVYHAEMIIGKTRIMMSDIVEDHKHKEGNSISLVITFDTAKDVKKAYEILIKEGNVLSPMQSTTYSSCFISLIDKFGMRWELMTEQTEV